MSSAKFQGNTMERPLVQKTKDVMFVPTEKNIALPVQSKRGNVPIVKNYPLNALLIVILS